MNRTERLGAAFVATFAVIVLGATLVGFVATDGVAPSPPTENDHYTDEDLVHDRSPGEARVSMDTREPTRTILVDAGSSGGPGVGDPLAGPLAAGSGATERDIRPLANVLVANGHEISVYTPDGAETLEMKLDDADAFVTFRSDYSDAELDDIEEFADRGGTVVSMTNPDEEFGSPTGTGFDSRFGLTTEPGYVYNLAENDLNYQRIFAEPATDSELTEGVDRVVFPTATPVGTTTGSEEFTPTDGAELSTTRAPTDEPILVRDDNVIKIGDSQFMTPENAQRADNDVLIGNLADVLVTSPPGGAPQPPIEEPPAEELPEELIAEEPPEETPDGE